MPATQWKPDPGLIRALVAEPYRFEFFQAMRLVGQLQPLERVRLGNRLAMAFPPSEIADAALESDAFDAAAMRITPAFLGLLGSTGALPLHYSQRIAAHERSAVDGGPRAFLDLLSRRSQLLFYLAWARHRPECMQQGDDDAFLDMLAALAGVSPQDDSPIAPETLARYAMLLRSRAASAPAMAAVYAEYFGVPFRIEQLAGAWQQLPPQHQASLGVANAGLDDGVLLGQRLYRCDALVRIHIGPMDRAAFERFLPGADGALALAALLQLHCGAGLEFDIRLLLRAGDRNPPRLGSVRLGVDSWLPGDSSPGDDDGTRYLIPS
jgi:type VI secretion system protein ImpH